MRPLFVTGTGTGIGKTLTSAVVLRRFGEELDLIYVKPVQTGCPPDDDAASVARLTGMNGRVSMDGVRLRRPVSPHLAAREEGVRLDLADLARSAIDAAAPHRALVEGAGGILVPLEGTATIADFITALDAVVIVAADAGLGTINHTLLTLAELRRRGADVAGVALCGEAFGDNAEVIESLGGTTILGTISLPGAVSDVDVVEAAARTFDAGGIIAKACA